MRSHTNPMQFGLASSENCVRPSSVSDPKAEYIGTEPWKPKEALEEEGGEITDKADIFAFGLTLWEMMTLAMPHLEMLEDDDEDEGEPPPHASPFSRVIRDIFHADFF